MLSLLEGSAVHGRSMPAHAVVAMPLAGKMSDASLPSDRPAGHQGPYGDREVAIPLLLRPSSAVQSLTHLWFDG